MLKNTKEPAGQISKPDLTKRGEKTIEAARREVAPAVPIRRSSWARPAAAMAVAALVLVVGGVTFRWFDGSPRREASGSQVVAIGPAESRKVTESAPVAPAAAAPSEPSAAAPAAPPAAAPPRPIA